MEISVKVNDKISKPIAEVFEAIVNPEKLSGYFTSSPSTPLHSGESVVWEFADAGRSEKISITEVHFNEHIRFKWHASGIKSNVHIHLRQIGLLETSIIITEEGWPMDKAGVQSALKQTQGWTEFICSLKAYLYCNIRLRDGRKLTGDRSEEFLTAS